MTFNGSSVIYFRGDASKKIYILQSGRVILKREDIETGQEQQEAIQTGEFFGVKSALGKYARDEDAVVVSDAQVVMFTVEEFEQLVSSNSRVGMKMLKVFSNQLRRIHSKVQSLLALEERNPEDGLFSNAEFYLKRKRYAESIYILRKYQQVFPQGRFLDKAAKYLKTAEEYLAKYGANNGPSIIKDDAPGVKSPSVKKKEVVETTPEEKQYYDALSLSGQTKYKEAIEIFQHLFESTEDEQIKQNCALELGRCMFSLKQYDVCIRHVGTISKTMSNHPDMGELMFLVGQCYEQMSDKTKAASVYERILNMGTGLSDDVRKKTKSAQRALGGS